MKSIMAKYKEYFFGSKDKFAITGKQWLDEHQVKYIFGEFYFACDSNVIGCDQTVILSTPRYSLESIISSYDYSIANELSNQSIENISAKMYNIFVENYNNPDYEERVEKYETLFLTLDICESLDGTYVFLVSDQTKDILLYHNEKTKQLSHAFLTSGYAFSVFRDYIAFIDDLIGKNTFKCGKI